MRLGDNATPRYVVATLDEARQLVLWLTRAGWRVCEGWQARAGPVAPGDGEVTGLLLWGEVADAAAVPAVLRAASAGIGVVVVTDPASRWHDALVAGLGRLGPVGLYCADPAGAAAPELLAVLGPEQRALLERLSAGETIAAAAAAEFMSLRTANRRMAQVRQLFRVATTREASLAYRRLRGLS